MAELTQTNGRIVIDYMARDAGSFLQSMRALIPGRAESGPISNRKPTSAMSCSNSLRTWATFSATIRTVSPTRVFWAPHKSDGASSSICA